MDKELRRLLELAGVKQQSTLIDNLYESQMGDLPSVDDTRYPPIKGMEGPFRMKNGRVVYYDPKEGQYYDSRTDIYLSDEEAKSLHENTEYVPEIVLFAIKEGETKPLKLFVESMSEIKPLATSLLKSGYSDFEYSVDEVDFRKPVFPVYEKSDDSNEDDDKLTPAQEAKLDILKKEHENGVMHKNMRKQYGKDEGDAVFYATLTKMAKGEKVNTDNKLTEHHFDKGDKVSFKLDGKEVTGTVSGDDYDPDGPTDQEYKYTVKVNGKEVKVSGKEVKKVVKEEAEAVDALVYDNTNLPANAVDDIDQKEERTGESGRKDTKMKHPKEVMKGIDTRIKELEQSIKRFDQNQFYGYDSPKHNAIDALKEFKRLFKIGDYGSFLQAQIHFGTLMSPIWDLFPASLVNYLHKGNDSFENDN